jgi:hypothetical protein
MKDVFHQTKNTEVRRRAASNTFEELRFFTASESTSAALKNRSKIPFIQQLDGRDFALGAMRLSWHKYKRFSHAFQR